MTRETIAPPPIRSAPARRGVRLYEVVAEHLAESILSGQLVPGDILPSEAELGAQFHVSRTVVREAVKVLADKGLVRPEPGRGTFVCRPTLDQLVGSMDTILRIEQCRLTELLELRRMIEVPIAGQAARLATAEHVATLKKLATKLEKSKHNTEEFLLLDKELHITICRAAGNELAAALVGALWVLCWKLGLVPIKSYPESLPYHGYIVEAIITRNPQAAEEAMAAHHDQIWQSLLDAEGEIHPRA